MSAKRSNYYYYSLPVFFLLSLLCLSYTASAQSTNSPYSRYGIGDVNNKVFGQGFAMGGTNVAMQNDTLPMFFINTANPASYAGNQLTTAELGVSYNRVRLESADSKKNLNNASFGYVSIAFPFKKWWGGSFGLIPYSSVGYNVRDDQFISNIGSVSFLYEGTGGISQVYFGNGIKPFYGLPRMFLASKKYARLASPRNTDYSVKTRQQKYDDYREARRILNTRRFWKSMAFGANVSYLFGSIDNTRSAIFSTGNTFNSTSLTSTRVGDMYLDYGLQFGITIDSLRHRNPMYNRDSARIDNRYDSVVKHRYRDLKNNVQILFGLNFAAQSNIRAKIDSLSYNYYTTTAGYNIVKDTVEFVEGHRGTITLPLSIGAGIALKKGDRWLVAADFAMQNWSSYQAFNYNSGLKNSMRVSMGVQYVPNSKALPGMGTYMKRVNYRIGGRYAQTALELKNSQLTEYALTFGIGLPVGTSYRLRNFSMVNIGVEIGQRGTTNNGLIKEQFFKTTLSFTINDRWFQKSRID